MGAEPGFYIARIDGRKACDKAAFLAQLADVLRFPDYFGGNLDALEECLQDLDEFVPASGYEIRIENATAACAGRRSDFAAVVEVLEGAASRWRGRSPPKPFSVVISD